MKDNELEKILQADPELDAELAQMADDVPPMPADFHDKWMNAVRAEAQQNASAPAEESRGKTVSLVRWTRFLSVAAVFVFLVGGTILYRNAGRTLSNVARKKAADTALLAAENVSEESAEAANAAAGMMNEEAAEDMEAADVPAEAAEESVFFASSAKSTGNADGAFLNETKDAAVFAGAAYEEAEAADGAVMVAGEAREEAADYDAAPAPQVFAAGMPEETAEETEQATDEEATEEEAEQDSGLLQQIGSFLADMGRFLLAALPYLAVLAVPAVIALVLRRRKKN